MSPEGVGIEQAVERLDPKTGAPAYGHGSALPIRKPFHLRQSGTTYPKISRLHSE